MVKELKISCNTDTTYAPGQTIAGTLTLEVEEPKTYQQIAVLLNGKGSVTWSTGSGEDSETYHAKEQYAYEELVLWKCEDSPDGFFPAGRYSYSFEFVIPANCPSSFKTRIGKIVYAIEGVISTGALRLNHVDRHEFQVIESVSIDTFHCQEPISEEKRKIVGCLCCVSGEIVFNAQVERSGYHVGDEIPVKYFVENGSGRQVFVRCELIEKTEYIASRSHFTGSTPIAKHSGNLEFIPPHTTRGEMYTKIIVPNIRPAITRSSIIKSNYVLNVSLVVPRSINSAINIPVSIGNASIGTT